MKRPSAMRFALLALAVAPWARPATAQHHPAAAHPGAGAAHVPQGMPRSGAGMSPQMHQQVQQHMHMMMMQEQMRQQQMYQMHQQMQEQHIKRFQDWLSSNGGAGAQGKGASGKLPDSPEAFQMWLKTQKDNKVHNRSYDPRYDQYAGFVKGNQHHNQANQSQQSQASQNQSQADQGHAHEKAESQAKTPSGHDPGRAPSQQSAPGTHAAKAEGSSDSHSNSHGNKGEHTEATKAREAAHRPSARGEHLRRLANAGLRVLPEDQVSVSLLRTVHMKLQHADADYDGHRVQALHHITAALHRLGSANAPVATGGASGAGTLAQSVSDGILRDAVLKLQDVHGRLSSPAAVAPHHADARNAVSEAIRELNTALSIR